MHINLFNRIEKEDPRFGYKTIKSDVEVEAFRQRIYSKVPSVSPIMNVSLISADTFLFNFVNFYSLDKKKADVAVDPESSKRRLQGIKKISSNILI